MRNSVYYLEREDNIGNVVFFIDLIHQLLFKVLFVYLFLDSRAISLKVYLLDGNTIRTYLPYPYYKMAIGRSFLSWCGIILQRCMQAYININASNVEIQHLPFFNKRVCVCVCVCVYVCVCVCVWTCVCFQFVFMVDFIDRFLYISCNEKGINIITIFILETKEAV